MGGSTADETNRNIQYLLTGYDFIVLCFIKAVTQTKLTIGKCRPSLSVYLVFALYSTALALVLTPVGSFSGQLSMLTLRWSPAVRQITLTGCSAY